MTEVVSVKFKGRGKAYYFSPEGEVLSEGDRVVVETARGLELGVCCVGNHELPDEEIAQPLRPVVRRATAEDLRTAEMNAEREKDAMAVCAQKIKEHGLDMKLVDVECGFEGGKMTFYFTADGRVDFRELVRDLASAFRSRIELRQIGVRDEAKMIGGIGVCGRPYCCHQFLDEFRPVSTKMAKVQSLSLNPTKISGSCGRLMCCLRYEEEAYEELVGSVPKVGAFVETPAGYGNVNSVNLLRRTVKVKLDGEGDDTLKAYSADEIAVIPGGRPRPGEPLPQILKDRPPVVKEPEEPYDDLWRAPILPIMESEPYRQTEQSAEEQPKVKKQQRRNKPQDAQPREQGKPRQVKNNAENHATAPVKPRRTEKPEPDQPPKKQDKPSGRKPYYKQRRREYQPKQKKAPQSGDNS